MDTIGVGLISVGWMGRLHSRAYRALPDHFPELGVRPRLVVAADPIPEARAQAVDRLGYERAVAKWHEVLADPDRVHRAQAAGTMMSRTRASSLASASRN